MYVCISKAGIAVRCVASSAFVMEFALVYSIYAQAAAVLFVL